MTKKKPRFGELPTLNMPKKSHEGNQPASRPGRTVVKDSEPEPSPSACYKNFSEFCQQLKGLKSLVGWNFKELSDRAVFKKQVELYLLPELEIIVDDSLAFTVKVFGSFLVEGHELYITFKRSMRNVTLSVHIRELEEYKQCSGVTPSEMTSKLYHHVIPIEQDLSADEDDKDAQQFPHKGYWRARACWILLKEEESMCQACSEYLVYTKTASEAKERRQLKPAHIEAPVSKTDPERIKLTLQTQRIRCAELEREFAY